MQKKYPSIKPLLIAVSKSHPVEHAYLIVRKDSPVKSFADLRGKKFDLPTGTKEHCRLFLQKYCKEERDRRLLRVDLEIGVAEERSTMWRRKKCRRP